MAALETHRMREVVKDLRTVSDKIRALDAAGFERADIARFLDKRYQHVRNVLEADAQRKRGTGERKTVKDDAATANSVIRGKVQIGSGGRLVIPAEMRAAMGIGNGDLLSAQVVDGELRLLPQKTAVRRAQELVRKYIPKGVSLVDELIEERRAEAARENDA